MISPAAGYRRDAILRLIYLQSHNLLLLFESIWVSRPPVISNLFSRGKPHSFMFLRVLDESAKTSNSTWSSYNPCVQADSHHLGRPGFALSIKLVESVDEVSPPIIASDEAELGAESIVIRVVSVWNDHEASRLDAFSAFVPRVRHVEGQVVRVVVTVVFQLELKLVIDACDNSSTALASIRLDMSIEPASGWSSGRVCNG